MGTHKNNLTDIISRENYAENVEISMDFSDSTLVLYGLSGINVTIAEAVRDLNYKSIILINRDEVVEAEISRTKPEYIPIRMFYKKRRIYSPIILIRGMKRLKSLICRI